MGYAHKNCVGGWAQSSAHAGDIHRQGSKLYWFLSSALTGAAVRDRLHGRLRTVDDAKQVVICLSYLEHLKTWVS